MSTSSLRPSSLGFVLLLSLSGVSCGSIPTAKYDTFEFPAKFAFVSPATRPFQPLGWVRSKVNYQSLDPGREETTLCKNFYNKAIRQLVDIAKEKGADAVVEVKSVVFLENGRREAYTTPECSDDGFEGQILVQGIAVKWKKISDPP